MAELRRAWRRVCPQPRARREDDDPSSPRSPRAPHAADGDDGGVGGGGAGAGEGWSLSVHGVLCMGVTVTLAGAVLFLFTLLRLLTGPLAPPDDAHIFRSLQDANQSCRAVPAIPAPRSEAPRDDTWRGLPFPHSNESETDEALLVRLAKVSSLPLGEERMRRKPRDRGFLAFEQHLQEELALFLRLHPHRPPREDPRVAVASTMSLRTSLEALSPAQRARITLRVLVSGFAHREARRWASWVDGLFSCLVGALEIHLDAPEGPAASFDAMIDAMLAVRNPRAILVSLEDHTILQASALLELAALFHSHDPGLVVPYDDPGSDRGDASAPSWWRRILASAGGGDDDDDGDGDDDDGSGHGSAADSSKAAASEPIAAASSQPSNAASAQSPATADSRGRQERAVLIRGLRRTWRSVSRIRATFALRLRTLQFLHARDLVPRPRTDMGRDSLAAALKGSIFAPLPSLSTRLESLDVFNEAEHGFVALYYDWLALADLLFQRAVALPSFPL
jgi:hypothetical protein